MLRPAQSLHYEPLVLAVDVARYGDNENVATFRRGRDARTIPARRWRGVSTTEGGDIVANLIATHNPDAVFVDEGGIGGGVIDRLRFLGHSVIGVNFGATAQPPISGELVYNKRAEMYVSVRTWLREGGCIENAQELFLQLVSQDTSTTRAASSKGPSSFPLRKNSTSPPTGPTPSP